MQKKINMAQVAKTQKTKKKKQHIISAENRKKLIIAHHQLYRAMFLRGLMSGMTIGAASFNALQFVRTKISTMDKANPVTKFLLRVNKRATKHISKRVMMNKNRDIKLVFTPEQRKKVEAKIPQWMNKAFNVFGKFASQYKPKQKVATKVAPAKQPTQMPSVAKQKQNVMGVVAMVNLVRTNTAQR